MEETKPIIQLKNIRKSYKYKDKNKGVLDISDLKIFPGKLTALVGDSGSGKTTLISILGLINEPDNHKDTHLYIKDTEFKFTKNKWHSAKNDLIRFRRKNIGFIFQNNYISNNLNIKTLIKFFRRLNGLPSKSEDIKQILSMVEFPLKLENSYPFECSGGQAQRAAIAAAIAKDPLIILADEPTSSLDYKTGKKIIKMFRHWIAESNKPRTVIWATHNIPQIIEFADSIILIADGRKKSLLERRENFFIGIDNKRYNKEKIERMLYEETV